MRLLLERVIDINGEYQETFSEVGSPVRGVSVHMSEWGSDRMTIQSGPTGSEGVVFEGACVVSGSAEASFGGPVMGPIVSVTWNGTVDLKRAVLRLWDEPLRPFGVVNLLRFNEAGVGAGGLSSDFGANGWGSWVQAVSLLWTGDQAFELQAKLMAGNVGPTGFLVVDTNGANEVRQFNIERAPAFAEFRFRNTGAAVGEVWATLRGYLG